MRISLLALAVVLLMSAPNAQAQTKIGYISLNELIVAMPEYKKANADMDEYQKALQQQNQDYQQEVNRLDSIFKADSTKWNAATKQIKRRQINEAYIKAANFGQEAERMMQAKEQELLAPIQQKAVATTQAVGKENGYIYILSKEQLISFPAGDDLLPLVAKKLNLTIGSAATPATTPPATGTKPPAGGKQ
jgi:outer membrane protein